jgi:hypothetical protein
MRRRSLALLPAALAVPARAAQVDLLLALVVDASGSIDADEFALQRQGYAEALADPSVIAAARSGVAGAIAVCMIEWGSPGGAATVVPWMELRDVATAAALGDAIRTAPRSPQSYNAIGDAIDHAARTIAAAPMRAERRVIDLSGDGPDMRSLRPAPLARDDAVAAGITINAIAIDGGFRNVRAAYERDVIGGDGAFIMEAADRADLFRALRAKLVREIAARPAGRPA